MRGGKKETLEGKVRGCFLFFLSFFFSLKKREKEKERDFFWSSSNQRREIGVSRKNTHKLHKTLVAQTACVYFRYGRRVLLGNIRIFG